MPGFSALITLLGLGALAWFIIRKPDENRKKLQDSDPKKKG